MNSLFGLHLNYCHSLPATPLCLQTSPLGVSASLRLRAHTPQRPSRFSFTHAHMIVHSWHSRVRHMGRRMETQGGLFLRLYRSERAKWDYCNPSCTGKRENANAVGIILFLTFTCLSFSSPSINDSSIKLVYFCKKPL